MTSHNWAADYSILLGSCWWAGPALKTQLCGQSFWGTALGCPSVKSSSMKEGPVTALTNYSKPITWSKLFLFYSLPQTLSQWALLVDIPRCQHCPQEVAPPGIPMIRPQIRINTHFSAPHPYPPTPTSALTHTRLFLNSLFSWMCVLGEGRWHILVISALRRPKQDDLCESGINLGHTSPIGSLKPERDFFYCYLDLF